MNISLFAPSRIRLKSLCKGEKQNQVHRYTISTFFRCGWHTPPKRQSILRWDRPYGLFASPPACVCLTATVCDFYFFGCPPPKVRLRQKACSKSKQKVVPIYLRTYRYSENSRILRLRNSPGCAVVCGPDMHAYRCYWLFALSLSSPRDWRSSYLRESTVGRAAVACLLAYLAILELCI